MTTPRAYISRCRTHGGIVASTRLTRCPVCHLTLNTMPRRKLRGGVGDVLGRLAKERELVRGAARAQKSRAKQRLEKEIT